jgi:hypothetical protein
MPPTIDIRTASPLQVLERLSMGERIQNLHINGLLDLDPLVVSRWLCGEDMRGIYQPIVLHHCIIDGIDLENRTFYEMVELVDCRISAAYFTQAYFYSMLILEDCIFDGDFHGRQIQNDDRVVIHNTVFTNWADFDNIDLRGRADLMGTSFLGGTNLLHTLKDRAPEKLGYEILLSSCGFQAADVPQDLDTTNLGIVPIAKGETESNGPRLN